MNKFNARKTTFDGITFDSKHEKDRYCELKQRLRDGEITDLKTQVPFELVPGFTCRGKKYRPIIYIADFMYAKGGVYIVEDAKGHRTKEYMIKRKLFAYRYKDEIREV